MHLLLLLGAATVLSMVGQLLSPDPVIVKLVVVVTVAVLLAMIPVSIMLRLRENKRRMQLMAQVDGVTGVTNQQTFLRRFTRALPQSGVLLMLDLDHFKQVNDMGDRHATQLCLMALAQRCREVTRSTDIVGRLDGSVFGIYLPGAPIERGRHVANELSKGIHVVTPKGVLHATVSVGVVVADGWTPLERLMKSVEQALDLAKLRGPAHVMLRPVVAA
ncbi:GGDEF domain-containing protein [Cognatiyoonia sp. IB215446]|uniref:GGDEF domain-containing protein n=1 Tax=Cognatiyoonia sp. IB215446 TaxID=3097355 RepID=UPI002A23BF27|nr:GGDEF domain-containing protein [Cognatiyoonia sp. IB215446]